MGARGDRIGRVDRQAHAAWRRPHPTRRSDVRARHHLRGVTRRGRARHRARARGRHPGVAGERGRPRLLVRRSRTGKTDLRHGVGQRGGGPGCVREDRRARRGEPRRAAEAVLGRALRGLRSGLMPTIRAQAAGPVPPEKVVAVPTDFSAARLERWPNLRGRFELHQLGEGWADVTEGSTVLGRAVRERGRYAWDDTHVRLTIDTSDIRKPGSAWDYRIVPDGHGG